MARWSRDPEWPGSPAGGSEAGPGCEQRQDEEPRGRSWTHRNNEDTAAVGGFTGSAVAIVAALVAVGAAASGPAPLPRAPELRLAPGFRAEVYARGLHRPTAMAYGPDGRLYLTEEGGQITVAGRGSTAPKILAGGFSTPLGLAWVGKILFVSSQGRLSRLRLAGGALVDRATVLSKLPFGEHQQDNVVLGPDGRLYLGNGSTCNACQERDHRNAAILSVQPNGTGLHIVARGLRNPYGLAFKPGTADLYASANARDDVDQPGNPEPAETIVRVRQGASYGWPDCWASARLLRLVGRCHGVTPPAAYLEPHSSADGIAFYDGRSFPTAYRGDLFVAEWGQYLSKRFGRRVVRVRLAPDGARSRVSVFADGFEHPLAIAVDSQGALLVADYGRGVVYRIQALGKA